MMATEFQGIAKKRIKETASFQRETLLISEPGAINLNITKSNTRQLLKSLPFQEAQSAQFEIQVIVQFTQMNKDQKRERALQLWAIVRASVKKSRFLFMAQQEVDEIYLDFVDEKENDMQPIN